MVTDREAEHIPGCNMAFYKWALEEIGGFDPIFRNAGDDVDVCWRLQDRGYKIGFSPAGFVWHYRRSTIKAYLRQQVGYGEAEAMLARKHPEYFNFMGGSLWRGRIYAASKYGVLLRKSIIYHGLFGSGFFQKLYSPEPAHLLMLCTSLEYHGLVTLPMLLLSLSFHFLWPVALASLGLSLGICGLASVQAGLPRKKTRIWSRPLVALLFLLQPVVRGWARYQWGLSQRSQSHPVSKRPETEPSLDGVESLDRVCYWSEGGADRYAFLSRVLVKLGQEFWQIKPDTGWNDHDVEIFGSRWSRLRLVTVSEELEEGRRVFRCRLQTDWSLRAKIGFWLVLGVELLIIGLLAEVQPWLWMLLLTLPLFGWYLEHEKRTLQRLIARLLDEVAAQQKMIKLRYDPADQKLVRVEQPGGPAVAEAPTTLR